MNSSFANESRVAYHGAIPRGDGIRPVGRPLRPRVLPVEAVRRPRTEGGGDTQVRRAGVRHAWGPGRFRPP